MQLSDVSWFYFQWIQLISNRVHILLAANKDPSVCDRGRGVDRFAYGIRCENLVLRPSLYNKGVTVFARQQNLSVESNWRRRERGGNGNSSAFVFDFTGPRIEAIKNAAVRRQIEIVAK